MPLDELRSVKVYTKGELLLPSVARDGIKVTTSQAPLPIFLNTAKPLLFVSLAVSHLSATFDLLTRAAVKDFSVTGSGAHGADGITMTTIPPAAGPALIVATKNKSCPPLAAGMLPLTGRDAPVIVNCVVSVMSASAEGD